MNYKALVAISACAFASLAMLGMGRLLKWKQVQAPFETTSETLFV